MFHLFITMDKSINQWLIDLVVVLRFVFLVLCKFLFYNNYCILYLNSELFAILYHRKAFV